jgi:type IV pilus assembly protein PilB
MDPRVLDVIPREFLDRHTILPLFKVRNLLTVAVAEPSNVFLLDQLRELGRCDVQVVVASAKEIRRLLQLQTTAKPAVVVSEPDPTSPTELVALLETSLGQSTVEAVRTAESSVHKLLDHLLSRAVQEGAREVHVEPTERAVRIRFRTDGLMAKVVDLPRDAMTLVTARLKRLAHLSADVSPQPQHGRFQIHVDRRPWDVHINTLPLESGEKLVLKLADHTTAQLPLAQLGFSADNLQRLDAQLAHPRGLLLVSGPSGSGITTTLYAALHLLATVDRNVCTVESPIEFPLPLVTQCPVRGHTSTERHEILRSVLLQQPDVLMVSELADVLTAGLALQAAASGRIVLASLPALDTWSSLTWLLRMGLEGHLVGTATSAVLAQRLVRRVCSKCREADEIPKSLAPELERLSLKGATFVRGTGCVRCRNTGYAGRVALQELLILDDETRDLLSANPHPTALRSFAQQHPLTTLRTDGLRKAAEGLTSLAEVTRTLS